MTITPDTAAPQTAKSDEELGPTFQHLAHRIADEYPGTAPDHVLELLVHGYAELETARVQGFRLVLAERAVRRRLRAAQPNNRNAVDHSHRDHGNR